MLLSFVAAAFTLMAVECRAENHSDNSDKPVATGSVIYLTDASFKKQVFNYETNKEWKYEGSLPAIVDFYADWCMPCKMVAPVLDELAKEYSGKIVIYKVNTEVEQELAAVFGIQSIPTILFIPKDGQPQAAKGALPKHTFEKAIKDILLKTSE